MIRRLAKFIWSKRGGQAHEENTRLYKEMLRDLRDQPQSSEQCVIIEWSPKMLALFEAMSKAESSNE